MGWGKGQREIICVFKCFQEMKSLRGRKRPRERGCIRKKLCISHACEFTNQRHEQCPCIQVCEPEVSKTGHVYGGDLKGVYLRGLWSLDFSPRLFGT